MQVGDLVTWYPSSPNWVRFWAIVIDELPGTDQTMVDFIVKGLDCMIPTCELEVINASR